VCFVNSKIEDESILGYLQMGGGKENESGIPVGGLQKTIELL
jgi:hypothetical protein